jgi:hypothetical protein
MPNGVFAWLAPPKTLQADPDVFPDLVSPSKFWRWAASPWGVRIADRIHGYREFSKVMSLG